MAARSCPEAAAGTAAAVVVEALSWVGTPYRHQAAQKGVGCDCLGLVRGVWRGLYGFELERPGAYAPDWAEAGGAERLLEGVRRHFLQHGQLQPTDPADLLLFRWKPGLPAKHLGIMVADGRFVHAYEGAGAVVVSALVPQWRARITARFAFPDISR